VLPEWQTRSPTIASAAPVSVTAGWPQVFTDADRFQPASVTATTPMSPSRALTLCVPPTFDVPILFCWPEAPYAAWSRSFVQWPAVRKCLAPLESVTGKPTEQFDSLPGHHGLPVWIVPDCCRGDVDVSVMRTPRSLMRERKLSVSAVFFVRSTSTPTALPRTSTPQPYTPGTPVPTSARTAASVRSSSAWLLVTIFAAAPAARA
jgi:hypothetical protein